MASREELKAEITLLSKIIAELAEQLKEKAKRLRELEDKNDQPDS